MSDLRLITLLPTQTVQGVQQSQVTIGTTSQGSAVIVPSLPPGSILSGFIVNRDASGNPILRTESGDIPFSSQFFLKIGSEVVIRIENTGGNPQAHILTVNGQPPEIAETLSAFVETPDIIVGRSTAAPVATPQAPATPSTITLTGTLISTPAQTESQAPQATPSLPAGSTLSFKVVTVNTPPTATAAPSQSATVSNPSYAIYTRAYGAPQAQQPASPVPVTTPEVVPAVAQQAAEPAQPQTPQAQPAQAQEATQTQPTANTLTATPQTVITTSAAPEAIQTPVPQAPPLQTGQTITATVIGNEPSGEALVQTSAGIVRLQPGTVLPSGSTITLDIQQISPPADEAASAGNTISSLSATPLPTLGSKWDTLQQIMTLLTARDTQGGMDFVPANMPFIATLENPTPQSATPPQGMSSGLMLFIAALRGGDFSGWLGQNNVQWLRDQGHDDLIKKASAEFSGIARQFTEVTPAQHWQALFFPIAVNGEIQQARLFVKRDRKKEGGNQQERASDDTRFVVEVSMSQLGEMQMDGFVRKRTADMQFDLIIRSLAPLPDEVQHDILQIYNDTGQITGYKGTIAFQNVREFPVNPMQEIAAQGPGTVMA